MILHPEYNGLQVLKLQAEEVRSHTGDSSAFKAMYSMLNDTNAAIDFCNVTVTYTHPGTKDKINVNVWLPLDGWNGKFMGMSGGGFLAGWPGSLALAVAAGYLQNFASVSLDDMAAIGKAVVRSYYGTAPRYSYWNGCSGGGRQGLMLAQRYPTHYDGILAAAPAIGWSEVILSIYWSHVSMREIDYRPPPCELVAIVEASIEACDELDGVKDGVISAPGLCRFDATWAVGRSCCDGRRKVSRAAAQIANERFSGPSSDGLPLMAAWSHGTPLASTRPFGENPIHMAQTRCDENDDHCAQVPFALSILWLKYWLAADPDFDPLTSVGYEEFLALLRKSRSWHGMADQLLPVNGTSDYYKTVLLQEPRTKDYFRYFEAPGVEHCMGGPGAFPVNALHALERWVEHGEAPGFLDGVAETFSRKICAYPLVARYQGGDPNLASSFGCAEDFGRKVDSDYSARHEEL
ncbi:hypothetical protein M409DRAFT_65997 [Zasmidium cellare ATCC 36951]|uniref:Carboxylic ester hydrolase n=1 Tax=Zasmidium cellare ATCC 36951 TaxID=1080233 RepID=A0A6A6CQC5_ZASCE|nr:uncharacterized protein M409DRAFT_65997 [Zasmidium cellare ATCC 36951]KAF2167969.1 hypothetical protein M409DRAFT_65997 [Zasmidium cellare ATCC 36951]